MWSMTHHPNIILRRLSNVEDELFDEIQKAHIELEQRKSVGKILINLR